jgi:predicted PurR-regulated permease PerM
MQEVKFTISTKSLFKVLGFIIFIYLVYLIRDILLILFVALIFSALIDPFANWFQKHKIPRSLAVLIIYIALFGALSLFITVLAPVVAEDVPQLISNVGVFVEDVQNNQALQDFWVGVQSIPGSLGFESSSQVVPAQGNVESTLSGVFSTVTGVFGGIFSFVLVLVMTFYMVSQEDPLKKIFRNVVPDEYVPYLTQLFKKMRLKLGAWLRGQIALSAIIGLLVFLGLFALDVRYAAVLGLLAAMMEFVPYLGPVFSAIPALLLAFSDGGMVKFVAVLIMYIIVQQMENHLLVPKVMQRAVGLNPIISIVALLIGAQLAGLVGVLLAIPVATALSVFLRDVFTKAKQ